MRPKQVALLLLFGFLLFCATAWQVFKAPTDLARYQCYAMTFWLGSHATALLPQPQCAFLATSSPQPPFHMLPLEYPPFTLLPFSLALLAPPPYYTLTFALLMWLTAGIICWLLYRFGPRGSALFFAVTLLLGACALFQERFDLLPALCTLLCVLAAERGRWTSAYIALALGTLLKFYPVVLLPALFLAEQRAADHLPLPATYTALPRQLWQIASSARHWHWRNLFICLGLIIGVSGLFALISFQQAVASPLSYLTQRPTQIESLQSSALWLAKLFGAPYQISYSFGSLNALSPLSDTVSLTGTGLCIAGLLATFWLQWSGRLNLARSAVALLLVLVATGKVFSPQYLIWLIPLVAYTGVFRNSTLCSICWGALLLLTTFIYIFFYARMPDPHTAAQIARGLVGFPEAIALRNALLGFLTLAYLLNWFGTRLPREIPPAQNTEQRTSKLTALSLDSDGEPAEAALHSGSPAPGRRSHD